MLIPWVLVHWFSTGYVLFCSWWERNQTTDQPWGCRRRFQMVLVDDRMFQSEGQFLGFLFVSQRQNICRSWKHMQRCNEPKWFGACSVTMWFFLSSSLRSRNSMMHHRELAVYVVYMCLVPLGSHQNQRLGEVGHTPWHIWVLRENISKFLGFRGFIKSFTVAKWGFY